MSIKLHRSLNSFTGLLALSALVHGVAFVSADRASHFVARKIQQMVPVLAPQPAKKDKLEFEFVEAPAKSNPDEPVKSTKISNRNALNQDLNPDKTLAASQAAPVIKSEGPSDQLAQQRGGAPPVAPRKAEKGEGGEEAANKKAVEEKIEQPSSAAPAPDPDAIPEVLEKKVEPQPEKKPEEQQKASATPGQNIPEQKPVYGLTGKDKITTQEMTRLKSSGAKYFGMTSFEATGSGMGEYMKNLKEKIWLSWFPYLAFKYPQDFKSADVVLSLTLNPQGDLTMVRIVESEGSSLFSTYCMEAVQRASGFGAVPHEILALVGKDELEIKFGFHYR